MLKTRIRIEAEAQKMTLGVLIRRSGTSVSVARRLWYNTRDGKKDGLPIESIHIATLTAFSRVLGKTPLELLEYTDDQKP